MQCVRKWRHETPMVENTSDNYIIQLLLLLLILFKHNLIFDKITKVRDTANCGITIKIV